MADNVGYTPGTGATVAADDIAGVLHQRVKIGVGADGTAVDVSSANPMPITAPAALDVTVGNFPASQAVTGPLTDAQLRASAISVTNSDSAATTSFGPVTATSTVLFAAVDMSNERTVVLQLGGLWSGYINLQQSNDGTTWWDANGLSQSNEFTLVSSVYAPDVVTVQVAARYFRAVTSPDFSGSVSGTYSLRTVESPAVAQNVNLISVDSTAAFPVAAIDQNNNLTRIRANNLGHLVLSDNITRTDSRSSVGTIVQIETTGYNSVSLQIFAQVAIAATIAFQVSNDGTTWHSVYGWNSAGAGTPNTTATSGGLWLIPAIGRFFRAQITSYTSGVVCTTTTLKNQNSWMPTSAPAVNLSQIASQNTVTAGVTGMLAVGGNIAVGSAPTANPITLCWDGTNTRRLLTDAVSGGVALGAAGVSNGASVSTLISAATNNLTQLKSTLGKLFIIDIQNTVASIRYLKVFNLPSASVTMGTTNATLNFSIPASGKLSIVTDLGINPGGTGLSYALTGAAALNDNTAIGAGDLICNFQFV